MMMKYTILYIINNSICSRCNGHYLIENIFKFALSSHINLPKLSKPYGSHIFD